jgi:hypothetical protein
MHERLAYRVFGSMSCPENAHVHPDRPERLPRALSWSLGDRDCTG